MNERSGDHWILRAEPRLSLALQDAARQTEWGLLIAVPEVILYYKASEMRPHDEADFVALIPHLDEAQRRWLADAISATRPEHSWLSQLPS